MISERLVTHEEAEAAYQDAIRRLPTREVCLMRVSQSRYGPVPGGGQTIAYNVFRPSPDEAAVCDVTADITRP